MSPSLKTSPELLHQPGEPEYTRELYAVFKRLNAQHPVPLREVLEWYTLQNEHIARLPLSLRNQHTQALTPRATLGGYELMVYPAGLGIMIITGLILGGPMHLGNFGVVAGITIGTLSMLLLNRKSHQLQQQAQSQLGLPKADDEETGINL